MAQDLNRINELIDSIRFHSETYGIDRSIRPPIGPKNSPDQQLRSARQTFVDLKILMSRLEGVLWSGSKDAITIEKEEEEISNRISSKSSTLDRYQ